VAMKDGKRIGYIRSTVDRENQRRSEVGELESSDARRTAGG
jgi:hypothetical protein